MNAADKKFARDAWMRALAQTGAIERADQLALPLIIDRLALTFGAAPALQGTGAELSYAALAARARQYSRWGLGQGLARGDVAALLMSNCPEYLAVWLGLSRIGVTVALINTHLRAEALTHCLTIVSPRVVIVGADLAPALDAGRARLGHRLVCWVLGTSPSDMAPLAPVLADCSADPLSERDCAAPALDAAALYIYTSGTTGLPKAAIVSHYRILRWSYWFAGMLDTTPADRMYDCLPLYHSVGGIVATGATLVSGGTVVIRPRFSASDFWRDVRDSRCTLFQYIGELCRYLVNGAPQPVETEHALRLACGNGLRPEVWERFQARFRIPRILEYYASTEGNFSLYNCEGLPGAIGRIPPFLAHRLPVALLQLDPATGEPCRSAEGLCIPCVAGEPGEAVGLMPDAGEAGGAGARAGRFEGYADTVATQRKVLRDVLRRGDAWYRTGDLMRRDAEGFYYFVDRLGDTFRWKGENVSTAEVLSVLAGLPGVLEGVVYGVAVPGAEGRAGMAALVVGPDWDLAAFRTGLAERLPAYARPVFLRLLPALDATGTFKPIKHELMLAGFDPSRIADALYVDDVRAGRYVPLDGALYDAIGAGALRL